MPQDHRVTTPTMQQQDWWFEFDLEDPVHCVGDPHTRVHDVPEPARKLLLEELTADRDTYDVDDLRDTVDQLLQRLEDPATHVPLPDGAHPTAVLDELYALKELIDPHMSCQCGLDVWDAHEQDYYNEFLSELAHNAYRWVMASNFNSDTGLTATGHPHHVVSELTRVWLGHNDILPGQPTGKPDQVSPIRAADPCAGRGLRCSALHRGVVGVFVAWLEV